MGFGKTALIVGASFVGVFGGHMLVNSILGPRQSYRQQNYQQPPPQNQNQFQNQQQQQVSGVDYGAISKGISNSK
eukprot:CAMPEP_0115020522 /NCGR_PEP_ID=MMETSP0216-20121206/30217_1 /TAXON_ID=223996 /ORGANISM="Protocruzia adherens, Strain Boccale" /LENGTH=74 /DNA_ID=CAMNT_0002392455 /DNA_START=17 /DNA_END=241 /DNA_ORIENTATION=+